MTTGKEKAAVVGAGAGALAVLLLTAKSKAAPDGVNQELWDMLLALLESLALQTASIDNLIAALGGTPGEDPFENTDRFITGQVLCPALSAGVQLPPLPIPKNKQLVVKALPNNVGWMMVAATQADSQNFSLSYLLLPNEGVGLQVKDASTVWVAAAPAPFGALNDGVVFVVETS